MPILAPQVSGSAPALRDHPSKLYVEVTTRCNLNCFMCVKQNQTHGEIDGDLEPGLFSRLEPAFPNLSSLILNGVGEPLLNLNLESYIRQAKSLMPPEGWVGFQSNGLLMTNLRAISLVDAGLDRVCLSIDAVSPDMFSRVRQGGEISGVENAFRALNAARQRCYRDDLRIGVEFVAMRSNLHELPSAVEWAARRGANFAIVTHLLPYDELHSHEIAFGTSSDQAMKLLRKWLLVASKRGIDLQRYFGIRFGRYALTREEQQVVDLVDAMKAEAEECGIFLDMKKLLNVDLDRIEELAEIFADVEAIAKREGIELRLPSITLTEQRSCSFIEEGSAFVSWQGNVSPCYFLWRKFQCYASGWKQQIQPKVFGNLKRGDILDIWNNAEFVDFRKGVLAYDYPSCASCGLAPCDYVNSDSFEHDCHIGNVPCGSCLWCMGVFQCLR